MNPRSQPPRTNADPVTTAAVASPVASDGVDLAACHQVLPDLARLLGAADLAVGPDRWQNVYDLLLALQSRRRLPATMAGLWRHCAP